jgi:hypothetical protein
VRSISLVPTIVVVVIIYGLLLIVLILIIIVVIAIIPGVIRVSTSGGRCWSIRSRSDWW